jgi:hypothetical protein
MITHLLTKKLSVQVVTRAILVTQGRGGTLLFCRILN